ncbi:FERM, ARHGEF and pleckstrin domain-containing protein [Schistosoma japonicum]|uniref:FERM, ARHGEF and pleckstrin domain-containing protein n=1 Tax=Schistosoma japonicum TaxID=6182 RepID=A0A4Z2D0H6_SCHJA|nr:FERM, ARHGEF and pleckstrin domain-containing protein [Schistosoma japonicum]
MNKKCIDVDIVLLDSTTRCFHLLPRALGRELYAMVVEHLQLVEYDYFDLEYVNKDGLHCWLDHSKAINKQISISKIFLYSFVVKFYTPHPNLLEDELTRYLFALQIKSDLRSGRLQCSESTAALLAAFIVQAKIGDFLEDLYQDHSYLFGLHLLNQPSDEMMRKIAECHRNLIGQSPAEADYNLLDTVRKIELYGIRMNPAKNNHNGAHVSIAVTHSGICVYQGGVRTNLFSWARIRKLSFKRKNFYIKVHPEGYDAIGFSFGTRNECKSFWKQCIEHHAFFRCQAVRNVGRKNRVVSKGSSFRYIGRTQKQLTDFIRENYIKMPNFERSSSTSRVLNTESSAMLLSGLKLQENLQKNNHDNPTVHSDFGPSIRPNKEDVVFRNRPQTDPSQRLHLASNLLSTDSSRSVAVAIPFGGQSNSVGSVGSYQILPENIQALRQRRSGSAAGQVIITGMNQHAQTFSAMGTASSGTYTINSSASAGTPTGSASPTGSPHLDDKQAVSVANSDYAAHIIWPNKLSLRPLSVSNIALPRPSSAPQSGWRASLPRHIMPNTSGILIAQPNVTPTGPMNVALIGTDSYPSMHASLLLTSKNHFGPNQINSSQANNLQIGTTTPTTPNVVMANNAILSSNLTPLRAICVPVQHQSVQLAQITPGGNKTVHSQFKLPPGCTILTGSGQTSNIAGRIIYVDRATGQSYIPVLTNASGNLNQVRELENNIPLTMKQPQFAQIATPLVQTGSPPPPPQQQQQQAQSIGTTNNEIASSQSDQQNIAQTSNTHGNLDFVPPDVTRNVRTVNRRLGPPPPAPERRDSVLQKTTEHINQTCVTESLSLSTELQAYRSSAARDQSDSQGEEETSDSPQNSQNLKEQSHPLAMGIITGPSGLHLASCLSLAARGRSALSIANLYNDKDGSDIDKVSDNEQNLPYPCLNSLNRPRILSSVSARGSDAEITDDDHHSVCSQRSSTTRSMSHICRHGHRHLYRYNHNQDNRQSRARCFSAIDPYMMYSQNGEESDKQNSVSNKQDSYEAENQINPHGVHPKPQTFRRLSKHNLDEAYHLIRELVMTERTYKRNLSVICVHFKDIGKDPLCSSININPQLLQELTSGVVDLLNPIYTEHCVILNNFENRLSNWLSQQNGHINKESSGLDSLSLNTPPSNSSTGYRIGDLFVASLHILPLYHCYLMHAGNIMLDIEKLTRTKLEIEQLLRNFEAQKFCYLPFYVFLLKPMHRLLQYRVILERLMRYYGEIHPDLSDCRIAHAKLNDLIQSQWESYKKMENTYKLLEIQRDLIGFNPDINSSSDLSQYSHLQNERNHNNNNNHDNDNKQTFSSTIICGSHSLGPIYHPNRQFIREGWLQKLSKKGYQPRMFFLLSDQLIYASRIMSSHLQFKVHGQFSLQDLMVEEVEPAHSFTIYSGNRCFLVAASSDWQRDRWLEDISRAILAAKTRPSSSTSIMNESIVNNIENHNDVSMKTLKSGTFESDSAQILQRAVTSVHVCWHRCFTLSMQDILRANEYQTSGYLLRKFKNSNGWQRLWVVFTQLCLFFYKSYRDECPLASLPLLGYTISKPGPEDQIRRDNVLKMQFKNHVYFFRGETRHSFERWVEYLSCAAGASRPSIIPSTNK